MVHPLSLLNSGLHEPRKGVRLFLVPFHLVSLFMQGHISPGIKGIESEHVSRRQLKEFSYILVKGF